MSIFASIVKSIKPLVKWKYDGSIRGKYHIKFLHKYMYRAGLFNQLQITTIIFL